MSQDKKEIINTLIVATLERTNCLTARDIYQQIWIEHPSIMRKGFRNFVTILNSNSDIQPIRLMKGRGLNYSLLK